MWIKNALGVVVRQQPYWDTGADHQVIEEKISCMQQDWNHWGLYQPHCCGTKALQQPETLQWLPKLNHVYFYIPSPGWVTWWSGWGEPVSYCHAIMLDLTTWCWQVYLILEEAKPKTLSLQHLQLPLEVYLWPTWRPSNISAPCGYLVETPLPFAATSTRTPGQNTCTILGRSLKNFGIPGWWLNHVSAFWCLTRHPTWDTS